MHIDNLHNHVSTLKNQMLDTVVRSLVEVTIRFLKIITVLIQMTATNKASNQFHEVAITESDIDICRYLITKVQ